MLKKLLGLKEARPLPPSDLFREQSISSRIRHLFQPSHKLGSSIGIFHKIRSFFANIERSKDRTEEASRRAMDALRQNDPGLDPHVHVKEPARKKPSDVKQLGPLFSGFTPEFLPMPATELCDKVIDSLAGQDPTPEDRLRIQTHVMAADRIHNSLWENLRFNTIDRNLPLGEGNEPGKVLKTLDELAKLKMDQSSKQSIEVLRQSVGHYQQMLRT